LKKWLVALGAVAGFASIFLAIPLLLPLAVVFVAAGVIIGG
jgi:hypothetical protein